MTPTPGLHPTPLLAIEAITAGYGATVVLEKVSLSLADTDVSAGGRGHWWPSTAWGWWWPIWSRVGY